MCVTPDLSRATVTTVAGVVSRAVLARGAVSANNGTPRGRFLFIALSLNLKVCADAHTNHERRTVSHVVIEANCKLFNEVRLASHFFLAIITGCRNGHTTSRNLPPFPAASNKGGRNKQMALPCFRALFPPPSSQSYYCCMRCPAISL